MHSFPSLEKAHYGPLEKARYGPLLRAHGGKKSDLVAVQPATFWACV